MDNTKGAIPILETDPSVKKGKNYFLGIGINDYTSGLSALNNAVRDVENIQSILFDRYNFDEWQILKNADATRERIEEELYDFTHSSKLKENDSLLIYYSGHGHLDTNNRGFWVPVDAEKGKIVKYLPNSRIKEIIADIKCRHVLLISDSCFSGSFFTRGRNNTRGNEAMEEYEKRISRWAFCSGRHNEVVSDGPPNGNSPFASAIIQELQINTAEKLNFVRLADKVTEITRSNYQQMPDANPIQEAGDGGGQFVFTLKDNEAEEWQLLDKTSVLALEGFVKKYPLSKGVIEATFLIQKLEEQEAETQRKVSAQKKANIEKGLAKIEIEQEHKKEEQLWLQCKALGEPSKYLEHCPQGRFIEPAFNLKIQLEEEEEARRQRQSNIEQEFSSSFFFEFGKTTVSISGCLPLLLFCLALFIIYLGCNKM